ncbi:D-inositol-3-phosphate glycosyltransferase [Nostocoides sp.]|uniref:D-inositol-3-phosphate glycosyltransferase n=1 Tax=Nostocoides sp. TaxID=1917966 RepID=UPI003BAED71B
MVPDLRRIAMISMHTSPLAQPGTGDAGGMNVYIAETARRLARQGVAVEIFTRATSYTQDPVVELEPGVLVRHVTAGPYEGLVKSDLPGQLCAFAAGVMREGMRAPEGWFDVIHSHYWLSGQVGWLVADRWRVPLVHTMHTMAKVKNKHLALDDVAEPPGRMIGEEQVVEVAQVLIANTGQEKRELVELYAADPERVAVVPPGVDLDVFSPGDQGQARAEVGVARSDVLLLFVGRIQPLKAPDLLVRAGARLVREYAEFAGRLRIVLLGGESGNGSGQGRALRELADNLGLGDRARIEEPVTREALAQWFRAADLVVVPSHSESFGLVAIEATACGIPVVAAAVGGLPRAVGDGGVLVSGHDPGVWASVIAELLADPARRAELGARGVAHAREFSWDATADRLLEVYRTAVVSAEQVQV